MDDETLIVADDKGVEIEMTILFTFEDERRNHKYVIYYNPKEDNDNIYASIYDDEGHLFPIESDEEWDMIDEVLGSFMDENGEEVIKVQEGEH